MSRDSGKVWYVYCEGLAFEQKILRLGRVILNMLNERRKALPFLCHYTPQMSFDMNIEFFNKINGPN